MFVRAGVLNLKTLGSTERKIIETIEHPDYRAPRVYFDVAICILDKVGILKEDFFKVKMINNDKSL